MMRPTAGRTTWRTLARLTAMMLLAALLAVPVATGGLAATVSRHDEVIAQGVAPMPSAPVTWRVTRRALAPAGQTRHITTALGFTLADADSFVVTAPATGARVILDPGEAVFHQRGAKQTWQALANRPRDAFAIELVPAAGADRTGRSGDSVLFAGAPFNVPGGDREVRLSRDVLAAGEIGRFTGSRTPMLIFVTDGALTVTDRGGQPLHLAAGKAALVSGDLDVQGGTAAGGTYVVARIARSIPASRSGATTTNPSPTRTPQPTAEPTRAPQPTVVPTQAPQPTAAPTQAPAATGAFRITVFSCPQGVDPSQSTDNCLPGQDPTGAFIQNDQSGQQFAISDGARDGDAWVLGGVPAATYTLAGFTKPGEAAALYVAPPAVAAGQDAWAVTIGAGQTVSVDAYWFAPGTLGSSGGSSNNTGGNADAGQLALWIYVCPAGTDPTSNASLSACQLTDDPYGFSITDTQGNGDTYATADAGRSNGGYIFNIPASVYQLSMQNVPADIDVYVTGNDVAGGGRNIAIHVAAGATSNVSIYLVPSGGAGG